MVQSGGASSRERKKQSTSTRVRATAIEMFERQGYDATTVEEIAAAAGIGRRTFFRYFPSKEALLFGTEREHAVATFLREELEGGATPMDALILAIHRNAARVDTSDRAAVRRRRLRHSLLDRPAVQRQYIVVLIEIEAAIYETLLTQVPDINERTAALIAGFWRTVAQRHVTSGQTHHRSIVTGEWHRALTEMMASFSLTE